MLTAFIVKEYQDKKQSLKTIGEFKKLGREFKDKYNLTDREAIDLLNNRNVLDILVKHSSPEYVGLEVEHREPVEDSSLDSNCSKHLQDYPLGL